MRHLELRTQQINSRRPQYNGYLKEILCFLNHPEDKIKILQGSESTEIQIYNNGNLLFSGDKAELFEKLKNS